MDSKLFTPKEKYHIASTVAVLFLILAILNLIMPWWLIRTYSVGTIILFGYVAIRNYIKMGKNNVETII